MMYITSKLLSRAINSCKVSDTNGELTNIERRFIEYSRIMKECNLISESFIPKWWHLGIQIASQYCSLMGVQLDDQLTQFPPQHNLIFDGKKKMCIISKRTSIR